MFHIKTMLVDQFTPVSIYGKIKSLFRSETTFLFESAINKDSGNFSFIVVGSKERLVYKNGESFYENSSGERSGISGSPFEFLKNYYKNVDQEYYKNLTSELGLGFVDGFIGYIGYDLVQEFEPTLKPKMKDLKDGVKIPDMYLIRPKLLLAYSHKSAKLTMLTSVDSMAKRFDEIVSSIESYHLFAPIQKAVVETEGTFHFSTEEFIELVHKSKEMIASGDVFQILISNRYTQKAKVEPFSFYRKLRTKNPSPYLFLLCFNEFAITGSSPEVMVALKDGQILLRPIAGTRKRGKNRARDKELELEMKNDAKERAEHIMLVDLGRNDVGRVAKAGTVKVTELMRVEKYSHVMHLVSDVEAEIDEKYDMFDLFAATFPAGTMTGAPKIRAMELIAEFEGLKRSFYSGAIGYFGFDGNMDSAITIRTALITHDEVHLHAGAGIVADSKPEQELLEVNNKMAALITSLKELSED